VARSAISSVVGRLTMQRPRVGACAGLPGRVVGAMKCVVPPLVVVEALERRDAVAVDLPAVDDLELHLLTVARAGGFDEHHADDPAIAHHPWSQKEILTISQATSKTLIGPSSATEKEQLMALANAYIADPEHLYRHAWEVGDLLVWDNLLLQHARPDFDPQERRTLRRCALAHDLEAVC
jgi:hypothetical protein